MTKKLYLTRPLYDAPTDSFVAELGAEIDGEAHNVGILSVGPDEEGSFTDVTVSVQNELAPHPCHYFPITNELHLTALVTMALFNAMTPDDETYADVLARGDVTVLEA